MAIINGSATGTGADVDSTSTALRTALYDQNNNPLAKLKGGAYAATDRLLPIGGINDGYYRPARMGRFGGQAIERFLPSVNYNLFTAALPPTWLAPATTMTVTHAVASGSLLNASAIGTASTNVSLISFQPVVKYQKSPMWCRHRLRLVKGATNGIADWGFFGSQAPASAIHTNGLVWLYAADSTLKPVYYYNGSLVASGTDIAGSINSSNYYTFDIIVDDDSVTFVCQDPSSGLIISEQVLNINTGDARVGLQPYFFVGARTYTTGSANVGAATQVYLADATALVLDTDATKPWPHIQAGNGMGIQVNPTIALTQLANWANSAAPTSATLSNTAAGYTTLGGQFQWAANAGAETDYALFGFTVPTGVKLVVTGISIDTLNTGAAVATTATWLSWFLDVDSPAITLAANSFRVALGNQVFPIAAAIGAQAPQINASFQSPLVTNSGRLFKIGVKIPLSTATASQIIRGTVRVEGYFE